MPITAEASTSLLSDHGKKLGHHQKNRWRDGADIMSEHRVQQCVQQALFNYLRLKDGTTAFSIDDPVPADDPVYCAKLDDVFVIYNEPQLDRYLQKHGKVDVVTDGNQPLS